MIEIGGMALVGWVVPGVFAVALILIVSGCTTSSRCRHTDLATVHRDPAAELKSVVCVDCGWKHVCHIDAKYPDKIND